MRRGKWAVALVALVSARAVATHEWPALDGDATVYSDANGRADPDAMQAGALIRGWGGRHRRTGGTERCLEGQAWGQVVPGTGGR